MMFTGVVTFSYCSFVSFILQKAGVARQELAKLNKETYGSFLSELLSRPGLVL